MTVVDLDAYRVRRGLAAVAPPTMRLPPTPAADLRRWRCFEARLSQTEAAELAGISAREWQRLETGRTVSRTAALLAIGWTQGYAASSC